MARNSNQMKKATSSKRPAPLQDRASTTLDGDVETLSSSQSRTSCKSPDNKYAQQRPQRKNKSKRRRKQRKRNRHQQNFDPSVSPNPVIFGQYNGSQSMPNSAYALPF